MTLNPQDYIVQKKFIKSFIDSRPHFNYSRNLSEIAIATNTHIVVVSYFIGEILGFNDEIHDKIKRDMEFYGIKTVIGYNS